jgi:D-arabinose 1-dehydrogenase-like Zn-dependent alcohol dehydrogenase
MRAIQYLGVNQVEYADVPRPKVEPGHVLLHVEAAGICQTDIQSGRPRSQ